MKIKLNTNFIGTGEVKGFKFTQLLSTEGGYLYKVDTGESVHYEVFKVKEVPLCVDFENRIYSETESKEVYPKSRDFGNWAYSYYTLPRAIKKLDILTKDYENSTIQKL